VATSERLATVPAAEYQTRHGRSSLPQNLVPTVSVPTNWRCRQPCAAGLPSALPRGEFAPAGTEAAAVAPAEDGTPARAGHTTAWEED